MCLLLPLLSIRNAIVRENKLGWNGIGWEGSRLCHQFDGTAPAVSVILPVSVVGLFVFGAHAFTVPWCTRLLAGHVTLTLRPSLTCTYFWADDRRWASLPAQSFVCTGFAPRNFKKASADRPIFCLPRLRQGISHDFPAHVLVVSCMY